MSFKSAFGCIVSFSRLKVYDSPLYLCSSLICLLMCCTWRSSLTRSMGATAVLEMAADTPPAMKSLRKETGSVMPMLEPVPVNWTELGVEDMDAWRLEREWTATELAGADAQGLYGLYWAEVTSRPGAESTLFYVGGTSTLVKLHLH